MRRRRARAAVVMIAALALFGAGVATTQAAPTADPAQPGPNQRLAPVMVVLDASGSMTQPASSGGTRMDEAKNAMHTLIDDVPDNSKLGLSAYGTSTGESEQEKAEGCQDIKTLQPVKKVNKSGLRRQVDGLEPSGYTPIGASLRHAADELPDDEKRAVVLISDGQDTCAPPPPCEVAKELSQQGVDLAVHTVGFRVNDEARSQLECVADNTGGSYTEAPDSGSLERALPTITDRAQRSYEAQGTPVDGSQGVSNAPRIGPGQYVDRIPTTDNRDYQLNVPEGMTARVAATQVWPADDGLGVGDYENLQVRLAAGGDKCAANSDGSANRWEGPVTTTVAWTNDEDSDCTPGQNGKVNLSVNRKISRDSAPEHRLELLVMFEPAAQGNTSVPGADTSEQVPYTPPEAGTPQPVTGGGSFNNAAQLEGPGRYSDSIKNGEWVSYRVWLDWGQALTYQVELDDSTPEDAKRPRPSNVRTKVYGPDRATFGTDTSESKALLGDATAIDPISTTPVAYDNRKESSATNDGAYLAGWHYITVRSGNSPEPRDVPMTLNVNVVGNKVAGPNYAEIAGYPAKPIEEGGQGTGGEQHSPAARSAATDDSDVPVWVWFAGGAVGLGAVALVVSLVLLRRRRAATPWNQYHYPQ